MYAEHLTPLSLFGKTLVANSYGCRLFAEEETQSLATLRAACALLAAHTREITTADIAAMLLVEEVIIPSSDQTNLGETGRNAADGRFAITLSYAYIEACSTAWVASIFRHEAMHYQLRGVYAGADLWQDELSACQSQLRIGNIIGFSDAEKQYLVQWMGDRDAMQRHMSQGFAGPPLPREGD